MNRKIVFILISLLLIVGCKKQENVKPKEEIINGTFSCKKEKISSSIITSMDAEYIVEISNNALKSYKTIMNYDYTGKDMYNDVCKFYTDEKTLNAYSSIKNKATCNDEKKTILVEKEFNIEEAIKNPETKEMINDLIIHIKDDKFDLNSWKNNLEKDGFVCK